MQQRVRDIQRALNPKVTPTLTSELHITVWVAGFPCETASREDDVAFAVLERQRQAVESARLAAPRLTVADACAFLSCAVLEVHDLHGDLAHLRAHLSQALDEVRFANFNAHITLGLFGDAQPTAPLVDRLRPYRGLDGIDITPRTLELIFFDAQLPGAPLATQYAVKLNAPLSPDLS